MRAQSRSVYSTLHRFMFLPVVLFGLRGAAFADDFRVPARIEAGQAFTIASEGSGDATFYLLGPDHVVKRSIRLGDEIKVLSGDVDAAGIYQVLVCGQPCSSVTFEVTAAQPARLSFFLHPSRVPVSTPDSIDATAFVFDKNWNLVLAPASVDFRIAPNSGPGTSRRLGSRNGIAWMRMDSTAHEGTVQVTATLGATQELRAIQQVAAEACGLRMKAVVNGKSAVLETDPVRDCSGNPLPDGTIVSFAKIDESGKSTVDTPIKKGVARTQFDLKGTAHISVACGVVLGNEIEASGKL